MTKYLDLGLRQAQNTAEVQKIVGDLGEQINLLFVPSQEAHYSLSCTM